MSARYLVAHFAHCVRTAVSAFLMTGGRAVVSPLVRASRYVLSCSIATANRCAATAQKMKQVAFWNTLRWNDRPCARFHFKQNVSFQRSRPSAHERFFAAAVKQPQRPLEWNVLFEMEPSARAVVSPQRFPKGNLLHFLCGAVAAQRLVVAIEHERTYLFASTSGETTARPPFFVCRSKRVQTSWIYIQDSWQ